MAVIEIAKIQVRRGQELQTGIPRLDPGEFGWAEDTEHLYIGKRIVEGANTDENSRILTENDLNNIFSLLGANSTLTLTTLYEYRDGIFGDHTDPRLVQSKLDDYVSLTDFGVVTSSTARPITAEFRNAVADLFTGDENNRRQLRVPAGNYILEGSVTLPSYTTIIGEGSGLTKLILINTTTNMFSSVGTDYITLSGMTLEYSSTTTSNLALLSLEQVSGAEIKDVRFTKSSSTFTMTNYGVGISLGGRSDQLDGVTPSCKDIYIDNCEFSKIGIGIVGTGTVIHPVISNSVFSNLQQGIKFFSPVLTTVPLNGVVIANRFEKIIKEGIFVGTGTNRTNHVSENNIFREVGTGPDAIGNPRGDATTSTAYPVISFFSPGNRSINDHFERQVKAANTTTVFYYNPLVKGRATITNGAIYTATISTSTSTSTVKIVKIPLTGEDQKITLEYSMSDSNYSRKGMLIANITSGQGGNDVYGSTYDHYDYSFVNTVTDPTFNVDYNLNTATNYNYVTVTCSTTTGATYNLSYQISFLS
jgi:hypothetical protein